MSKNHRTSFGDPVKPRFTYKVTSTTTIYAGDRLAEGAALLGDVVGLDVETTGATGQDRWQVKVVTISDGPTTIVADPRDPAQRDIVRDVLGRATEIIVHNAQFDLPIITGADMAGVDVVEKVTDTLILSRAADPARKSHSLGALCADVLGLPQPDPAVMYADAGVRSAREWYARVDLDYGPYVTQAAADAAVLPRLRDVLVQQTVQRWTANPYAGKGLTRDEAYVLIDDFQTAGKVMLRASCQGLALDREYITRYTAEVEQVIADAQQVLYARGVIEDITRAATPRQLAAYLETSGLVGDDYPHTGTGALSTSKADLVAVAGLGDDRDRDGLIPPTGDGDPVVRPYLVAKERRKVRDDYLAGALACVHPVTGRVHSQVELLGAAKTGRMAAKNPALQQWPSAARPAISFREIAGGCVSIDWKSIEPVIAMAVAGEHGPLAGFLNHGHDLYVPTARAAGLIPDEVPDEDAAAHPGRKQAKVVLLGLLYGKGARLLAQELGVSEAEARRIRDAILGALPAVSQWMDQLRTGAESTGVTMTAAGRVVPVARDPETGVVKGYLAQNYFHQGSASDVLTAALVGIHRAGLAGAVRMAVHDELIVDAKYAGQIAEIMENAVAPLLRFDPRLDGLTLPTDGNPLPTRWAKV